MNRDQLNELHYIAPIRNVPLIMQDGILSHNRAKRIRHQSVAISEIQEKRARKVVPGGSPLHDYVNLYFCARNPMLYRLQKRHSELCVLQIDIHILDLPQVVITDGNAASGYTRFSPSPNGLEGLEYSAIFAEWWTHPDQRIEWENKRRKCAEVLVPNKITPDYILGAYVSCETSQQQLLACGFSLPITIDGFLFFR